MALRPLREPIFAGVAEPVDDIAPVGGLVIELDVMAAQRLVYFPIEAWPIGFRSTTKFGAAPVHLVDDQRDQLRHAFKRRALVHRQRRQGEEVLQKCLLQRQRILATDLKVEDVELEARRELQ